MRLRRLLSAAYCAAAVLLCSIPAWGEGNFTITLVPGRTMAANQPAIDAFNRAADEWSSHITTAVPVNIIINADFVTNFDANTIGSTSLNGNDLDFDTVRNAIVAHASPSEPATALLPTSGSIQVHTLQPNTFDRTAIFVQSANQKILGLMPGTGTGSDDLIQFNGNYSFDYTGSSVAANKTDFQSVAAHEIGHVLGFDSTVDDYDANPGNVLDLMPLDLYRFNSSSVPTLSAFTTAVRELAPGASTVTSDTINSYLMSTGSKANGGDGNAASHWKDDAITGNYIGVMDPTISPGTIYPLTEADLQAMALIGYTVTPEPSCFALAGLASFGLLIRRRRA